MPMSAWEDAVPAVKGTTKVPSSPPAATWEGLKPTLTWQVERLGNVTPLQSLLTVNCLFVANVPSVAEDTPRFAKVTVCKADV